MMSSYHRSDRSLKGTNGRSKAPKPSSPSTTTTPSYIFFAALITTNSLAALYAPILDCDEVFNYWEPTHYLTHGFGFQTWEYSPEYAIRSWLYILLHAGNEFQIRSLKRIVGLQIDEFVGMRLQLGLLCTICQVRLLGAVSRAMGLRIASIMALVMCTSTGMFFASVAYLPSSFSMYAAMLGMAAFLESAGEPHIVQVSLWFGIGAIIGWPFSGALMLPLIFDELAYVKLTGRIGASIFRIFQSAAMLLPFIVIDLAVNAVFFRRLAFSPWRIISYNIFSGSERGPDIFGTEPWHFYARNLLLNFNLWTLLALCAAPILLLQAALQQRSLVKLSILRSLIVSSPFYLWLAVFSAQPHKEERFMYPAYPFLCLNAAMVLHFLLYHLGHVTPQSLLGKVPSWLRAFLVGSVVATMIAGGVLRTLGMISAYRAPLQIYAPLKNIDNQDQRATVCLGKEWYRFPSSYHLPNNMRAAFVKSEFEGLLPGHFSEEIGVWGFPPTWKIPKGMNDQNLEDPGKYVDITSCDYLVDSYFHEPSRSQQEPDYMLDTDSCEKVSCERFLDAAKTHALARIFWVPDSNFVPARFRRQWGEYCLLKRR